MEARQSNVPEAIAQQVENIVEIDAGQMFTTSLIVAEAFEKEHKDVLKAISNLECSKEFHERNFAPMVYEAEIGSGAKREFPAYRLTRDGFAFLAMGFTGKKAAAWKEKFLEAFNAMEKALRQEMDSRQTPLTHPASMYVPTPKRSPFFKSREKINDNDLAEVTSLLRMQSFIQNKPIEEGTNTLCEIMNIKKLTDLKKCNLNEALHKILGVMFHVDKKGAATAMPDIGELRSTLDGLIKLWVANSNYTLDEVLVYACNRCDIDSLADLTSESDLRLAILSVWTGIANHVFKHRRL